MGVPINWERPLDGNAIASKNAGLGWDEGHQVIWHFPEASGVKDLDFKELDFKELGVLGYLLGVLGYLWGVPI